MEQSCARNDSAGHRIPNHKRKTDFQLGETVTFGYSGVCHATQMVISEDGLSAYKRDPSQCYAHGVVHGAQPLKGIAEFELEILRYGTGWSGTLKMGVVRVTAAEHLTANDIPRYSPDEPEYCMWCSNKLHNNIRDGKGESYYGKENLDHLREGSRIGLKLDRDGNLLFLVNGLSQGVACTNLVREGYDLYPVVDHYANCIETRITRSVAYVEVEKLQEICLKVLRSVIPSSHHHKLPLPHNLLRKLHQ